MPNPSPNPGGLPGYIVFGVRVRTIFRFDGEGLEAISMVARCRRWGHARRAGPTRRTTGLLGCFGDTWWLRGEVWSLSLFYDGDSSATSAGKGADAFL